MLTVLVMGISDVDQGPGIMFEGEGTHTVAILETSGWTLLIAVNLMLFSLIHNP
jgi:ferrous iron transport protein B